MNSNGTNGWGWPESSRKAHYFVDGRSLCGKWLFSGLPVKNQSDPSSPDDCKVCREKLAQRRASEVRPL